MTGCLVRLSSRQQSVAITLTSHSFIAAKTDHQSLRTTFKPSSLSNSFRTMHTSYTAVVIALAVSGRSVAAQNSGYSVTSIADAPFIISGADSSENNFIVRITHHTIYAVAYWGNLQVTTTADAATCQSMCTGGPITQSDGSSKRKTIHS